MDEATIQKYVEAGEIAKKAQKYAATLIENGMSLLNIAEETERKIYELGGKTAFPVNVSVNKAAAHYIPSANDSTVLHKGDLIKIDTGVHVNGYVADTAFSKSIGKNAENDRLIKAAEAALKAALDVIKPGLTIGQLSEVIQNAINSYDVQPIKNLTGHSLDRWQIHAGLTIPNIKTANKQKLKEGTVLAIEPFTTTGVGITIEGALEEAFAYRKDRNVRVGREILAHVKKDHKTLPVAKRWLIKRYGQIKTELALRELVRSGAFVSYRVLNERSGKKVAQAEHTVLVLEDPIITTK